MDSLRQKDAGLVKVMEEDNVGDFWMPAWPIFIKGQKEVRKHKTETFG